VFSAIGFGAAAATFLAQVTLAIGSQLLSTALGPKLEKAKANVKHTVELGDDLPLSFCVGDYATAGKRKYAGSFGGDTRFLVEVIEISAIPISGIKRIWVNDEVAEIDWDDVLPAKVDRVGRKTYQFGSPVKNFSEDVGEPSERDRMWVRLVDGTQTAADAELVARFKDDEDYPWTEAMVGRGKAYLVATYYYDPESMTRVPSILVEPEPLPLYDPRRDSSVGGSGPQRWGQQSTYEGTSNNAVIAYNVARGIYWQGEWIFGGRNLPSWRLPLAEWVAAMNACDDGVNLAGGGTEPYARCGMEISVDMLPLDVLKEIGASANMRFASCGGVLKPIVGLPGASAFVMTDEDIVVTEGQSYRPFAPLTETFNAIQATFPLPAEKWASKTTETYVAADYLAEDGGRSLPVAVTFGACPHPRQVRRLMRAQLRDFRRTRTHQFCLPPDAFFLEPLVDALTWTSQRNGYDQKRFVVESVTPLPGLCLVVQIREIDPADYDWSSDWEVENVVTVPRNPRPPTQVISGFGAEPHSVRDEEGSARRPGILARCDGTERGVTGIRIQVALPGHVDPVIDVIRPWDEPFQWVLQNVLPFTAYLVRARLISKLTPRTPWTGWVPVLTDNVRIGSKDLAPGSIEEAVAAVIDDLNFDADQIAAEAEAAAQAAADVQADLDALVAGFTGTLASAFDEVLDDLDQVTADLSSIFNSATGQVRASALSGYYTKTGTDNAIAAEVDSLESAILNSTGQVRASLLTGYYTRAQTDGAISGIYNTLSGMIADGDDVLQGKITNILGLNISPNSALATTLTDLVADVGEAMASVTAQGTAIADIEGRAAASYVLRVQAGSAGAIGEFVAANNPNGPVSHIRFAADQILLDGTVSLPQLVVTDFSGNLILNGAMTYGDTRGWGGLPPSYLVIPKSSSPAVLASSPTPYVLRQFPDAALQALRLAKFDVRAGERFSARMDAAAASMGSGIDATFGYRFVWQDASGAQIGTPDTRLRNKTGGAWEDVQFGPVTAPAGASSCIIQLMRRAADLGAVYITNMECVRQRSASMLISPRSITGAELVATEAIITEQAQIGALVVGSAQIRELAVDTFHVAGDAITTMDALTFANVNLTGLNDNWIDLASVTKTVTVGDKIMVNVSCVIPPPGIGNSAQNGVRIVLNGAVKAGTGFITEIGETSSQNYERTFMLIADSPSLVIRLQARKYATVAGTVTYSDLGIGVLRAKK
jgi:uncharacterized protein YukE